MNLTGIQEKHMQTNSIKGYEVDHVGYAVREIRAAKPVFEAIGFKFGKLIYDPSRNDPSRNVNICFGEMGGVTVELIEPAQKKRARWIYI